jgi:hypothetical protein
MSLSEDEPEPMPQGNLPISFNHFLCLYRMTQFLQIQHVPRYPRRSTGRRNRYRLQVLILTGTV